MKNHILGYPRFGAGRELKSALEAFWKGDISEPQLEDCCRSLRHKHWKIQQDAGLSWVAVGDFSMYDHILDTSAMLGAVPQRFRHLAPGTVAGYFKMARGDADNGIPAMEMTKWFNTNYHFIVPEIDAAFEPRLSSRKLIAETLEAIAAGFSPKPVLVGPVTYIALSKGVNGYDCWQKLNAVVEVYAKALAQLDKHCEWIQIDEPILTADLPQAGRDAFISVYRKLNAAVKKAKLLLTVYFDVLDDNLDLALNSGCAGLHLDLVRGGGNLDEVLERLPQDMMLSAGIVEGRNIWKNDFAASLDTLEKIKEKLGERMLVASSCSLLHVPADLNSENKLDAELKSWMAFALQKCSEVNTLSALLTGKFLDVEFAENQAAILARRTSTRVHDGNVDDRVRAVTESRYHRSGNYQSRKKAQDWLKLPLFPTTTIGSFPQTGEIRSMRRAFRQGKINREQYTEFLRREIAGVIARQEEIGLDVLVHGEPERNDMVEYFGQQLNGFCFTENGWVQSYGSRCVKPPVIFGDVSRPLPMTVDWIKYAQSLTMKPVKGMLTGPVTMLCWSFVRDDIPRSEVCTQLALAILDEVRDLEQAGIRIIQIDEAAFSEGMPVKERDRSAYLEWAVRTFRLATSGVKDSTQIHTHMCYSEFNRIIRAIAAMDADVISIEASRSKMELLEAFRDFEYPNEIGPGVYDIHSPRIPSRAEML
ncbi:MAG: 5-methyltetrahydropteroyltriglutamate--homocysteine S-methyltransferase, partial [Victivallales bacterium]|nr:5-methyltetrahydropteroyltriglutamate--homocysteine S-methyltransferase [Victivallales bacterium]